MRALGMLIAVVCAVVILREYDRSRRESMLECEAISELLIHIKRGISENMTTVPAAVGSFDFSPILHTGLREILTDETGSWRDRLPEMKLRSGSDKQEFLYNFLVKFGTGTTEEELSSLGGAIDHFRAAAQKIRTEESRASKVRWVILATAVAGAVILML